MQIDKSIESWLSRQCWLSASLLTVGVLLIGCMPRVGERQSEAMLRNDLEAIKQLYQSKEDTLKKIQVGNSSRAMTFPLHLAVGLNRKRIVEHLLSLGADPNAHDHLGNTAFFAIRSSVWEDLRQNEEGPQEVVAQEIISMLIEAGGDIDQPESRNGLTPLMYAAMGHDYTAASLLVDHGATVNLKDDSGRTALDFALSGYVEDESALVTDLLRSRGGLTGAELAK